MYRSARNALATLRRRGDRLCVTPQNIVEFRNVCTRPASQNGLGSTVATATRLMARIERMLSSLPGSPLVHSRWKEVVSEHAVVGIQVHDARLAAAMAVHGVTHILTFNTQDFSRYTDLRPLHPTAIG